MKTIRKAVEFEWDRGNIDKNWVKHKISNKEAEESFFDKNSIAYKDVFHSKKEERLILLGKTKNGRLLYTVYTLRGKKIRIISSRMTNKKEVRLYEKKA